MKFLVASLFLILLGAGAVQSFGDELSDIIFKQYAMLKVWLSFFQKFHWLKPLSKNHLIVNN